MLALRNAHARHRYLLAAGAVFILLFGAIADLLLGSPGDAAMLFAASAASAIALMLLRPNTALRLRLDKYLPASWDKRLVAFALFAFGSAAVFAKIAEDVVEHESPGLDRAVSLWVHSFDTPGLDTVMLGLSYVGSFPVTSYVAALVLIWCWRSRDFAAFAGLLGVIAIDENLNHILKDIFDRPRPTLFEEIATLHSYSFPSGHAMAAVANYGMIAAVVGRLAPPLRGWVNWGVAILALLIGLSRIYLGVHWVTDVLAGYAAGTAILFAGILWLEAYPPTHTAGSPPARQPSSNGS